MVGESPFPQIVQWANENIVMLVEEATGKSLGPLRGGVRRMACPLHDGDNATAFAVYPAKGRWMCFSGCSDGEKNHAHDAVEFLVRARGWLPNDKAARTAILRELAPRANVKLNAKSADEGVHPDAYRISQRPTTTSIASSTVAARTKTPDPFEPTKPKPDTSALNGGESSYLPVVRDPSALAVYPYQRADGALVALKVRKPDPSRERGKTFTWRHADGRVSGDNNQLPEERKTLVYRLPDLHRAASEGETLVLVGEGEKVVDALRSLGFTATCHNGSASSPWLDVHAAHLAPFRRAALFPDNDRVGRTHMESCAIARARVSPEGATCTVFTPNEWDEQGVGDVADYIAIARAKDWPDERIREVLTSWITEAFAVAANTANPANPANPASDDDETDDENSDGATPVLIGAPQFASADLYGPLGEWVRTWEPHTEATPVALYVTALTALGAMIGRNPYMGVSATLHHGRLFTVIVGPSGRARKGDTIKVMKSLVRAIDPAFVGEHIETGLSTSEGLINRVRDDTPERDDGKGKMIPAVRGVTDKRLLVVQEEMATVLAATQKPGSTLSDTLRELWDGETLRRLTRAEPLLATDPHVCLVGAITPNELRKRLTDGDVFNGFANRILPVYAASEQCLPIPATPAPCELNPVVEQLGKAVQWARALRHEVRWTPEAADLWDTVYRSLKNPNVNSDALRALHERGAPYVLRMALLLALLDQSKQITVAHLDAAVKLWQYASATWHHVFPAGPREGLEARLEAALRAAGPNGLDRTALREAAGSNDIKAAKITAALHKLREDGLAVQLPPQATGGRSKEMWRHSWCVEPTKRHVNTGAKGATGEKANAPVLLPSLFPPEPLPSRSSLSSRFMGSESENRGISEPLSSHQSLSSPLPTLYEPNDSLAAVFDGGEPAGTT